MSGTEAEHGVDQVRPGPEGWGKCVHWHREEDSTDFPRTGSAYADDHLAGVRWLLNFGFAVDEVHYGAEGDHWSYTVGLARFGHPELLMHEVSHEIASVILAGLAWQVVLGGRRFVPSDSPITLGGAEVRIGRDESEEAREDYQYLPLANFFNGGPVDWLSVSMPLIPNSPL